MPWPIRVVECASHGRATRQSCPCSSRMKGQVWLTRRTSSSRSSRPSQKARASGLRSAGKSPRRMADVSRSRTVRIRSGARARLRLPLRLDVESLTRGGTAGSQPDVDHAPAARSESLPRHRDGEMLVATHRTIRPRVARSSRPCVLPVRRSVGRETGEYRLRHSSALTRLYVRPVSLGRHVQCSASGPPPSRTT